MADDLTTRIDLDTEASISNVTTVFEEHAQNAKKNCPVSRALSGVDIYLRAELICVRPSLSPRVYTLV